MEPDIAEVDPLITRALVVWPGRLESSYPMPSRERLIDAFGRDAADELEPQLRNLLADFQRPVFDQDGDPRALADIAGVSFRERHPEVGEDGVSALRWTYLYNNK